MSAELLSPHLCRGPATTAGCDCGRCCTAANHEPGCNLQPLDCDCPDTAQHDDDCPRGEQEAALELWRNDVRGMW
jgi:hypothetical protein